MKKKAIVYFLSLMLLVGVVSTGGKMVKNMSNNFDLGSQQLRIPIDPPNC